MFSAVGFRSTSASAEPSATPVEDLPFTVDINRSYRVIWPADGPITSRFSANHPTGIDVGLEHDAVAPIYAAAPGVVNFAGGDPCCEYGYFVTIDHAEGVTTLYAHFSRMLVSRGQQVTQGQLLGYGGATGVATGKHLHFEVRRNGAFSDPLQILPPYQATAAPTESIDCRTAAVLVDYDSPVALKFTSPALEGFAVTQATLVPVEDGQQLPDIQVDTDSLSTTLNMKGSLNFKSNINARLLLTFDKEGQSVAAECVLDLRSARRLAPPTVDDSPVRRANDASIAWPTPAAGSDPFTEEAAADEEAPFDEPIPAEVLEEEPEATETPESTATNTATPATTGTPGGTTTPATTGTPGATGTPGVTGTPPVTATPATPTKAPSTSTPTPVPPTETPPPPTPTATRTPTRTP